MNNKIDYWSWSSKETYVKYLYQNVGVLFGIKAYVFAKLKKSDLYDLCNAWRYSDPASIRRMFGEFGIDLNK